MNSKDRMPFDGLNTLNYTLLAREFQRLVTIVHVKVEEINVRTQFLTNQYKQTDLLNLNQRQIEKINFHLLDVFSRYNNIEPNNFKY